MQLMAAKETLSDSTPSRHHIPGWIVSVKETHSYARNANRI